MPRRPDDRVSPKLLRLSLPGLSFIKRFETLQLRVYDDGFGYRTVGYGHRTELPLGHKITELEAINLLRMDIRAHEGPLKLMHKTRLYQREYDAVVSLVFNIGTGAFAKSTIRKLLEEGNYRAAADEFPKWNKVRGKVVAGLVRRRAEEREIFINGTYLTK